MDANKFFAAFEPLFLLLFALPVRLIRRIPLTSVSMVLGIGVGFVAAVLAAVLISPLAARIAEIPIWGFFPVQVYWGIKGTLAVAVFFLFGFSSSVATDWVLLFLCADYPRPKKIHHDRYPLHLEGGGVIYRGIIFRGKYTAFFLAPFAGLISFWRDFNRVQKQYESQFSEEEAIRIFCSSSFPPDI